MGRKHKQHVQYKYGLVDGVYVPEPHDRFEQVHKPDGSHYLLVTHLDGSQERFTSGNDKKLVRLEKTYRVTRRRT